MNKLLTFVLIFLSFFAKASHISGGQITYQCLGNNVYQVKLTYFWDCQGGFNPGSSQTINVDGCGTALTMVVNQSTLTPGDGIQADGLCPNSGLTTCKKRIEYIGTITLPSACNNWVFSIGSCCRGGSLNNISGGTSASYYHFATLNNTSVTCNNSPDISIGTLPNFCVNQPACFNLGATELDGHTLSYAFIDAYQTSTTFVTYNAGYTGAVPMTGITIDPATGQVNFTPTTIGDFVITVQITEKDANGNIIGTIMRDFQVIVTNCSNQTVTCGQGAISNVTSGTVPGGSGNTLQICENIPFCFDVTFTDPNVGDSVKVSSPNMALTLPGSSMVMTYTPGTKNKVKATICWTPPAGSSGLNTSFVLIVKDNACPVPGTQIINYFIDVLPATMAGPDRTICGPQAASITATGSSTVFAWSDLAGNPIAVGPAFSCNPCSNPVIKPAVTSTYVVTNVGGGANCKNKDTLVINVVPDFTLSANVVTSSGCLNSAVQFTSAVAPSGAYTYTWSPSTPLTSINTANTSATYSVPGNYSYTLTATSSLGCTKQTANINFIANPVVTPQFTVVPTNTTVCSSSAVPLSINFGNASPTTCGLAATGCVSSNIIQIGNGTSVNSTTSYPAIYGNFYKNTRHQILYLASELLAAGIVPGKISSIAFNISTINGTTTYPDFTIKIKCTSVSDLTSTAFDNTGLTQVYYSPSINITTGWNTYSFSSAYEWDGTSNLLIDVCDGLTSAYTNNSSSPYTITPFNSVRWFNSDGIVACMTSNTASAYTPNSTYRPNVRFGNCTSTPPASSFSYAWSPTTGLSNPSIANPTANITSNVVYSVVVTPTAAATCSNVGTTSLTLVSPVAPSITAVPALCSNAGSITLSGQPAGGTWSLTASTSTTGVFTPSLAAIGNNTVTYLYGGAGCMQTTTAVIPVERYVPSTITGTINPLCLTSSTVNLATALTTSTLGTGVWSGPSVTGTTFNPGVAGAGTHTLTYSTNSSPTASLCPSSSTIAVSVISMTQPTIAAVSAVCSNAPSFSLSALPTGGTWSLTAATSTTGIFNPSLATIGSNTVTYIYGGSGCALTATASVPVERYVPSTITGTINPLCLPSPAINLATALTTSTLGTGVWSGPGVSGTTFDPNVAGAGTQTLTYSTNSSPTASLCPSSSTIAVSLILTVQPTITAVSSICSNAASFSLSANPAGGTWNVTSATSSAGVFTPSLAAIGNNTVTYVYGGGSGCLQTTTAIVPVEQYVPSTITGTINPLCLPSTTINLATALTTSSLGTGVWSGNGVTGAIFDPVSAGVGTHTLTYTTNSSPTASLCPSSSTTAIMVNSATQPTITSAGPYCTNAFPVAMNAIPTGGTWTGLGMSSTGVFTPSVALVGNNTYTYTVGSATCSASSTTTISIEQYVPSTITGNISTLCVTSATINLSTALTTSTLGTGVWSGPGVTGTTFNPGVAGAGTHTFTYSTNSSPTATLCPSNSTVNVTVNSVVQPTITPAGPYCDNFAAQQMFATPSGGVWSPATMGTTISSSGSFNPVSSIIGNNKIYYTLSNAPCVKKDSINVSVVHFVPATITGVLGPYCIYDPSVNLQPTAQFAGGVWSGPGVTGSSFNPSTAGAGNQTVTYFMDPAPAGLCPDTKTLSILVNPKPNANAFPNDTSGCMPLSIDYRTTTGSAAGTAVWVFGDGTPNDTGIIVTHIYSVPGTYTATLYYTENGCKDTTVSSSDITVHDLPIASFEPSVTETTVIDGQVEFTNHSTVLNNNSYAWDIGGLYASAQTNESYLFTNSGNFVVTLTATTIYGCVDDTSIVIKVNPDVVLYVPNAFTPGSDGLNDVFQVFLPPSGADYSTYNIIIYDRWGELVFQSTDVTESWTGAKNNAGPILKQDVYVWKITFQDEKKKHYEKIGHVSLLRK